MNARTNRFPEHSFVDGVDIPLEGPIRPTNPRRAEILDLISASDCIRVGHRHGRMVLFVDLPSGPGVANCEPMTNPADAPDLGIFFPRLEDIEVDGASRRRGELLFAGKRRKPLDPLVHAVMLDVIANALQDPHRMSIKDAYRVLGSELRQVVEKTGVDVTWPSITTFYHHFETFKALLDREVNAYRRR